MDFSSQEDKKIEKEFIEQGYIIRPVADKDALDKIKKFALRKLSNKSLDKTHESVSINELNTFRLDVIKEINDQPWLREAYFQIVKPYLDVLVGKKGFLPVH